MDSAPKLPTHVSADGREVWAWADALSEHTQRLHKIRQLQRDIFTTGRECGDCDKWMKSRECPRERNINGMSRGPSCGALPCGQFVISSWAAQHRDKLQAELAELQPDVAAPAAHSPVIDGDKSRDAHPLNPSETNHG